MQNGLRTECRKVHIRHFLIELHRFGDLLVALGAEMTRRSHLMSAQLGFFFVPGHPGTPQIWRDPGKQ